MGWRLEHDFNILHAPSWLVPSSSSLALVPRSLGAEALRQSQMLFEGSAEILGWGQDHVAIMTSGSTSRSGVGAWVILSREALSRSAQAVNQHLQVNPRDRWACALPLFHVGGLGILVRAQAGGNEVCHFRQKWQAGDFCRFLQNERVTLTSLVPTQVFDLVSQGQAAPKDLRAVVVGGGMLPVPMYLKARQLGWPLLPSYGMTEFCSQVATADLSTLETSGYPDLKILPHAEVRTAWVDGERVLEIRSSCRFTARFKFDDGQWRSEVPEGDWYRTSDRGRVVNGNLIPRGRVDEKVKILGELVDLAPLRQLWAQLAGPSSLIVDMPDSRRGKRLVAVIEGDPKDRHELERQFQEFNALVGPLERLESLIFFDAVPRSELGKVLWGELRSLVAEKQGGS